MVPYGASVGFCSAPVAVVFGDLDEAQPKTIAMLNKTAKIAKGFFLNYSF